MMRKQVTLTAEVNSAKAMAEGTGCLGMAIGYWASDYDGETVTDAETGEVIKLDWDRAERLILSNEPVKYLGDRARWSLRSALLAGSEDAGHAYTDGTTSDLFVQIAAFGEVVFG